jgi:hypothetical protein
MGDPGGLKTMARIGGAHIDHTPSVAGGAAPF